MKKAISLVFVILIVLSCSTVPITGRSRINIVSDSEILPASFAQYEGFLKENEISTNIKMNNEIKTVGVNISRAVDKFMRANGVEKLLECGPGKVLSSLIRRIEPQLSCFAGDNPASLENAIAEISS